MGAQHQACLSCCCQNERQTGMCLSGKLSSAGCCLETTGTRGRPDGLVAGIQLWFGEMHQQRTRPPWQMNEVGFYLLEEGHALHWLPAGSVRQPCSWGNGFSQCLGYGTGGFRPGQQVCVAPQTPAEGFKIPLSASPAFYSL